MPAEEDTGSVLGIISVLLGYPGQELLENLQEMQEWIGLLAEPSERTACLEFTERLRTTPLTALQEHYTETFDLNPSTCLHLTFHQLGESSERGRALAGLNAFYKESGYELATKELPDHLSVILEFLAVCPDGMSRVLQPHTSHIVTLEHRLQQRKSPYASLIGVISRRLQQLQQEGV